VVKVRRNSDDAEADFTAVEVSDGTLLAWVNADVVTYTSDFSTGSWDGWLNFSGGALTSNIDGIGGLDDNLRYTKGINPGIFYNNFLFSLGSEYTISVDYYFPSSNTNTPTAIDFRFGSSVIETVATPVEDTWNSWSASGALSTSVQMQIRPANLATGDIFYIRNVVITQTTADGHVSTWYDQSGNTKHATQATAANQPKIVDAGVLVLSNGNAAIKATSNNVLNFSMASLSADGQQSVFSVLENDITSQSGFSAAFKVLSTTGAGTSPLDRRPLWLQSPTGILYFTSGMASVFGTADRERRIYSHLMTDAAGGTATVHQDGVLIDTRAIPLDANSTFSSGSILETSSSVVGAFYMSELIYYPSDQSDNRTAFEANIGEAYGIAGIPAYDNTVNGFVETWYDQSGNGNDATQTTAANQPKIVDTGVLVLSNGNAAIKSTASNSMSFSMASLSADGQQSVFGVLENDVTSQNNYPAAIVALSNSDGSNGFNRRPYWFTSLNGSLVFSADSLGGYTNSDRDRRLYSHIMEDTAGGTSTVYQDGTQVDTRSITLDANPNFLSAQVGAVGTNAVGALYTSEIIYYPSDESAKRAAIENNIDNHYGITSAGSYVNAAGDSYINAAGDTYLQP
jgi:hypothetical protein